MCLPYLKLPCVEFHIAFERNPCAIVVMQLAYEKQNKKLEFGSG